MTGYCHECKFYNPKDYLCNNTEAFDIVPHTHYSNMDVDGGRIILENTDPGHVMIPLNFGCIHFEQGGEDYDNYNDDYDDEEDGW